MIRDQIIQDLEREVCGPDPNPAYLDNITGEEILLEKVHGSPKLRYGAGMLYPQATIIDEIDEKNELDLEEFNEDSEDSEKNSYSSRGDLAEDSTSDESIGLANEFLPSAMGFTCKLKISNSPIKINIQSAWYERSTNGFCEKRIDEDQIIDKTNRNGEKILRNNWTRRPLQIEELELNLKDLGTEPGLNYQSVLAFTPWDKNQEWLVFSVYNRSRKENLEKGECILTFSIVNKVVAGANHIDTDRAILFQNQLSISDGGNDLILPYEEHLSVNDTEDEEELLLLYRNKKSFGIGHGCSVYWDESKKNIDSLSTTVVPVYELPQVSATSFVNLSMYDLSDLGNWELGTESLNKLIDNYSEWINDLEISIEKLDDKFHPAARKNISKCRSNLERITAGVEMLTNNDPDPDLVKCFRWMNRAMIWQQQRSKTHRREWISSIENAESSFEPINDEIQKHESLEQFQQGIYNGKWRPFQIAFILMNIESIWNKNSSQREIVDLIWFPTGGGKTEAYLGLAGFTIFARRIRGKDSMDFEYNSGTAILMRYTLRLLTTQQYERASSLICACELIRKEENNELELGPERISIGLWVGSGSTPNKRKNANQMYKDLIGNSSNSTEYNLIIMKCPCCGSSIGKVKNPKRNKKITGVFQTDGDAAKARIYFSCENKYCEFFKTELPLYVVDEDIFEFCPTLVLGTVDKFAMIPWQPNKSSDNLASHNLFGFRKSGEYKYRITPPELIIQDELHLISGPLGTMVGLYESLILTLCNDYGKRNYPFFGEEFIAPKIVASSATISRAAEQTKALYGKENLNIFPPQGIDFGNTWFSAEALPSSETPGRKYVGVLAPGYRSGQTAVVRLYSSILQSTLSADYSPKVKNYYWTLLGFFNSIRELGMAASLVYADIKDYLKTLQNRNLTPYKLRRRINLLKELTSRINNSEIPDSLKELEKNFNGESYSALDICIATNMIATGVDISRLGLMIIHGQPKTTAEYIQASSRVGRDPRGPGLVIMLYSPSKPRDKSQYEHFQSFHNKIYSFVEPTSVTPFSINARERALHAVLIGLTRCFSKDHFTTSPDVINHESEFEDVTNWIKKVIRLRCSIVDSSELENTMKLLDKHIEFWKNGFQEYGDPLNKGILTQNWVPLMFSNGSEVSEEIKNGKLSLPTQTSMRGVDEETRIGILNLN